MSRHGDARERYVTDFQSFAQNGASHAPQWLRDLRAHAIARFAELGWPTTKQEDWRFTSVASLAATPFVRVTDDGPGIPATQAASLGIARESIRIGFVNGRFAPALSSVSELPHGVTVGSLARAVETDAELTRGHLARHASIETSAFTALNTAFMSDGAFVHLAANVALDRPVELLFLAAGTSQPTVCHPRTLVVLDRGAAATVAETYASLDDGPYWTNGVTEISLGDGATLEHFRVQQESERAYQVAATHTSQGRDSMLRLHAVSVGAVLARHDLHTVLAGTGGELVLNGLYLLHGQQHADHHTVIEHAQPHATSHEYFNGILSERAHGVFNGRIVVRPGAQRTDSKQTNNNLLLSADARADSQPQLEIYADDVKCTHGSTVGPLDQAALYYLRSRGLSTPEATGMLTYGFADEIVQRMQHPALRDAVARLIRGRLVEHAPVGSL